MFLHEFCENYYIKATMASKVYYAMPHETRTSFSPTFSKSNVTLAITNKTILLTYLCVTLILGSSYRKQYREQQPYKSLYLDASFFKALYYPLSRKPH